MFLWLLLHERILTIKKRNNRGFTTSYCKCYPGHEKEDLNHLFRFCKLIRPIWQAFLDPSTLQRSHDFSIREWLYWHLRRPMQQGVEVDRSATFSSCLWWIWRWRNEFIFQNLFLPTEEKLLRLKKYSNEVIVVLSSQPILDGRCWELYKYNIYIYWCEWK